MQKKRFIQKIIFSSITAILCTFASHADWETISCPNPNIMVKGPYENTSSHVDTSLESLRKLNKYYWFAYYTNSRWNNWSGVDEDNHFYLVSSVTMSGWDKVFGGTQLVKRFELPQASIEDASKVRVSFDVMKVIPIEFSPSVNPWVNSASLASDISPLADGLGNTVFNFSIISLVTGNTILSDKGVNWHHSGVNYDRTTVSFILEGADLYGGDEGYALIVNAVYDGTGTSNMDCYVFENTKIEKYIDVIPEPSTAGLCLISIGGLIFRRRMK